jgi:hypothetical protein
MQIRLSYQYFFWRPQSLTHMVAAHKFFISYQNMWDVTTLLLSFVYVCVCACVCVCSIIYALFADRADILLRLLKSAVRQDRERDREFTCGVCESVASYVHRLLYVWRGVRTPHPLSPSFTSFSFFSLSLSLHFSWMAGPVLAAASVSLPLAPFLSTAINTRQRICTYVSQIQ